MFEKKRQTNKTNEKSNSNNNNKKFSQQSNPGEYWNSWYTPNNCAKSLKVLLNKKYNI